MPATIGFDFGTSSVRALVVDLSSGADLGSASFDYPTGEAGIILDSTNHNLARQNANDYLIGMEAACLRALAAAAEENSAFSTTQVIAIGVDTTGSTPLPVDERGNPLSDQPRFKDNPNAYVWLWKDHVSHAEAAEITTLAEKEHPEYLAKCGGSYSSEWFFSKILHCLRTDPELFDAAYTWVECCDYIPAVLTGLTDAAAIKRGRCAAGHKAMYSSTWGGLPSKEFLGKLDSKLASLRDRLFEETHTVAEAAGELAAQWATRLGLPAGIPVAIGALDAHLGAVGAGVKPGTLIKIMGTSTCDILVAPMMDHDVPGICGVVDGSVLPHQLGLEAGQAAVGDIFDWFVTYSQSDTEKDSAHQELMDKAHLLKPGQSGLLALDWNNGNRTVLADQRLTGLMLGQTLHTKPEETYRALVEATAFGSLTIINRFEENNVHIDNVIACGGVAEKNAMLMQIYADVLGREMKISSSGETCALGSAIAAAVVAGEEKGGYADFESAQIAMCSVKERRFTPIPEHHAIYQELYMLYKQLHDAFGVTGAADDLSNVMKKLLEIKARAAEA